MIRTVTTIISLILAAVSIAALVVQWKSYKLDEKRWEAKKLELKLERENAAELASEYRQIIIGAPQRAAAELGNLVDRSTTVFEGNDQESVIAWARSIVSTRDAFRDAAVSFSLSLNSDIDELEREANSETPNYEKIRMLLQSLAHRWPAKQEEIEIRATRLLSELGCTI